MPRLPVLLIGVCHTTGAAVAAIWGISLLLLFSLTGRKKWHTNRLDSQHFLQGAFLFKKISKQFLQRHVLTPCAVRFAS
jgi:hypothetical protein